MERQEQRAFMGEEEEIVHVIMDHNKELLGIYKNSISARNDLREYLEESFKDQDPLELEISLCIFICRAKVGKRSSKEPCKGAWYHFYRSTYSIFLSNITF
jgi:hypothetical protein